MQTLEKMKHGKSGEIRLADAFDLMLEKGSDIYGKKIVGEWLDTGNKLNFFKASLKFALKDKEISSEVKKIIKKLAETI